MTVGGGFWGFLGFGRLGFGLGFVVVVLGVWLLDVVVCWWYAGFAGVRKLWAYEQLGDATGCVFVGDYRIGYGYRWCS